MNEIQICIFSVTFIFLMTTLGAALIYLFKNGLNEKFKSLNLGFASGVMIASSIWSLLLPSFDFANEQNISPIIPGSIGFIVGGLFLVLLDVLSPHLRFDNSKNEKKHLKKTTKLFLAVTLHNIPEGLAVGLALGIGLINNSIPMLMSGLALAVGIGIQNLPEGLAIAIPINEEYKSKKKGFFYGMVSGIVEPIFAVIGIVLSMQLRIIMPWALSFAAGAMIYVVVEELIPEANLGDYKSFGTWGLMIGFVIMMMLDVALG